MNPESLLDEIETEVESWSISVVAFFKIKNQTTSRISLMDNLMVYDQDKDSFTLIRAGSGYCITKYAENGDRIEMIEGSDTYWVAIEHAIEKIKILLSRIKDQNLENFKTRLEEVVSKMNQAK